MKLAPKNWSSFQHYKDRAPPWVKLHKGLLDDRQYQRLPTSSRALAPMLWLLASESKDGSFDGSIEELAFRLRANEAEVADGLQPLIDAGFFLPATEDDPLAQAARKQVADDAQASGYQADIALLADRKQVAVPETETETETEAEKKEPIGSVGKADLPACRTQEIVDAYHEALPEMPSVKLMNDGRRKAIAKLWRWVLTSTKTDGTRRATTADEATGWVKGYFQRVRDNDFLMGRGQRTSAHEGWRCDLDFLLTDRGMKHVIEKTGGAA